MKTSQVMDNESIVGFHEIPEDDYHKQIGLETPALTYSIAKLLVNQSPRHAYHYHAKLGGNSLEPSDDMDLGTIVHTLILGQGQKFAVLDAPDWRKKEAQEFRERARSIGLIPVLECKLDAVREMIATFEAQILGSDACRFYTPGTQSELVGRWEMDGVLCQSLFDRINLEDGHIWDIKTTTTAHPKKLVAKINDMGYDIQSEFYRAGLETLRPEFTGRSRFTFLFVETAPPYSVTPVEISGLWRAVAQSRMQRAFILWRECLASGRWPSYTTGEIVTVDPPKWVYDEELSVDY